MNYFGHAALACRQSVAPPFVLGAMLPDLCAMVGAPAPSPAHLTCEDAVQLAQGLQFHLVTDAVFHQTPMFVAHNQRAVAALRGLGISRGPARAAGHMGVEMLIDAVLVTETQYLTAYQAALSWGSRNLTAQSTTMSWFCRTKLAALCNLLLDRGATTFEASVRRIADRLSGALSGRRLLAPTAHELTLISTWLAQDQAVEEDVPQLLLELSCLDESCAQPTAQHADPGRNALKTA